MACITETTFSLLYAEKLSPVAVEEAELHLKSCARCLELLLRTDDRAPPVRTPELPTGTLLGRYVVLNLVGRGGMGEVYAAYDPELDRRIAVKLLRADREGEAGASMTAHLLREAQAIARLSHPSVVVVYDVGICNGQVFIAMEFVKGQTAAEWVRATPRSWQDILRVYVVAGHGLAAAHHAGLVHRDFKPHNVMVGEDGSVRITDFGLARWVGSAQESPSPSNAAPGATSNLDLIGTGTSFGTPAYMAPEQRARCAADARSDQFSYCVSLHEALYGRRPGDTYIPLVARGMSASRGAGPVPHSRLPSLAHRSATVPRWVRLAVDRGLNPAPADRWPSMSDLLDRLERTPVRRRRMTTAAVLLSLGAMVLGLLGNRLVHPGPDLCSGAARRLDGVWELSPDIRMSRRAAIKNELAKQPGGGVTFARLAGTLDRYASAWVAQHTEACEATNIRKDQSSEALDLRMDCLGQRLADVRALSDLLVDADAKVFKQAVEAALHLPPLESCADVGLLRDIVRPSLDSNGRLATERQRIGLAEARAMVETRRYSQAKSRLVSLLVETESLHNGPLVAEVLALQGKTLGKLFEYREATTAARRAFSEALKARHDEIAAEAATQLIALYAAAGDPGEAAWQEIAKSFLDRIGGHETLRAFMLANQAFAADRHGQYALAVELHEKAIAILRRAPSPDTQQIAGSLASLSECLTELGQPDRAMRAVEEAERVLGQEADDGDPDLTVFLNAKGDALNNVGRFEEARASFQLMLRRWQGPDSPDSSVALYPWKGIAYSFLGQGRAAEATIPARRAVEVCSLHPDFDVPACAEALFTLARCEWETGSHKRALGLAAEAEASLSATPLLKRRLVAIRSWRMARHSAPE
jgi:tetratricopeptide (TPR) repeat protein